MAIQDEVSPPPTSNYHKRTNSQVPMMDGLGALFETSCTLVFKGQVIERRYDPFINQRDCVSGCGSHLQSHKPYWDRLTELGMDNTESRQLYAKWLRFTVALWRISVHSRPQMIFDPITLLVDERVL